MTRAKRMASPRVAAVGGTASAIALAATLFIAPWEGLERDPYIDIAGVLTVCYGETQGPMRRYTEAECLEKLLKAVETRYMPKVLACVPALEYRPYAAVASISLAYNIGTGAFCKSTAARRFNAGDWRGGCEAFGRWVKVKGRVVPGLVNRRRDEIKICKKGL